jgi:hypothetical protein
MAAWSAEVLACPVNGFVMGMRRLWRRRLLAAIVRLSRWRDGRARVMNFL